MARVMDAGDLDRAIRRIAHEVVEKNRSTDELVLLGIQTRGVPLAGRLAGALEEIAGAPVSWGSLDIGMYRDDLDARPKTELGATEIPIPLTGKTVVLVDDVLYTGRTIRAALDALADIGRPSVVQLAVLIDRGHRELPIRPDYVGKNVPTSHTERVSVKLEERDGEDSVVIESGERA
ncbi:MAG: bifunctional pyr operon transcriptional regulator/uracil phosphoribosyltransferase PyrR [Actinomycetota bacterium]